VLERRDDALALDPVDGLGAEDGADVRILGVVLEVPPVARVAGEIDAAGKLDVESPDPRLAADRRPPSRASLGLKLEPTTMDAGNAVAPWSCGRYPGLVTPMLASLLCRAGMPSRGIPDV
jgi:hypothetical protein